MKINLSISTFDTVHDGGNQNVSAEYDSADEIDVSDIYSKYIPSGRGGNYTFAVLINEGLGGFSEVQMTEKSWEQKDFTLANVTFVFEELFHQLNNRLDEIRDSLHGIRVELRSDNILEDYRIYHKIKMLASQAYGNFNPENIIYQLQLITNTYPKRMSVGYDTARNLCRYKLPEMVAAKAEDSEIRKELFDFLKQYMRMIESKEKMAIKLKRPPVAKN